MCMFVHQTQSFIVFLLLESYRPANRTEGPQGFYKTCTLTWKNSRLNSSQEEANVSFAIGQTHADYQLRIKAGNLCSRLQGKK